MGTGASKATNTAGPTTPATDLAIMKFVGGMKLQAMRRKLGGKNCNVVSSEDHTTNANESCGGRDADNTSLANKERTDIKEQRNEDCTMMPAAAAQKDLHHNHGAGDKAVVADMKGQAEQPASRVEVSIQKKEKENEEGGVGGDDDEDEDTGYSPGIADLWSPPSFREYCRVSNAQVDSDQERVREDGNGTESSEPCQRTDCGTPITVDALQKAQPTRDRFRRLKVFSHLLNASSCYNHQHSSATHDTTSQRVPPSKLPPS